MRNFEAKFAKFHQTTPIGWRSWVGVGGLLQLVLQAFYPALIHLHATDEVCGRTATFVLTLQTLALTTAGLALLAAGADWLVPLVLGPDFIAAGPLFRALLPVLIPVAIASPATYALMARGESLVLIHLQIAAAVTMTLAAIVAFQFSPTAWSALVLYPVLWGQAVVTVGVAWRLGAISYPADGWRRALDLGLLSRLIRHHQSEMPLGEDGPQRGAVSNRV